MLCTGRQRALCERHARHWFMQQAGSAAALLSSAQRLTCCSTLLTSMCSIWPAAVWPPFFICIVHKVRLGLAFLESLGAGMAAGAGAAPHLLRDIVTKAGLRVRSRLVRRGRDLARGLLEEGVHDDTEDFDAGAA